MAMEACCGAHHLGRVFGGQGHEVRLMSPAYVRLYVKAQKNDDRDAEAIAEAATRPTMRFVPVKSVAQSDVQALHRARERLVAERTALINHLRALLLERGITVPQGRRKLAVAVGDARTFGRGRDMAAWLGLTPRQRTTGGKPHLLGISKRGNRSLRKNLIYGARAVLPRLADQPTPLGRGARGLLARAPKNVAIVALANKLARIVWAVLAHGRAYDAELAAA